MPRGEVAEEPREVSEWLPCMYLPYQAYLPEYGRRCTEARDRAAHLVTLALLMGTVTLGILMDTMYQLASDEEHRLRSKEGNVAEGLLLPSLSSSKVRGRRGGDAEYRSLYLE